MSNNPRIAIIGCGAIVASAHLPALRRSNILPAVLVDPNVHQARKLAEAFGVERTAPDYRDCVSDIDAAIIALPHHLHAPICSDLLRRGIHVLVEKPMATSEEECRRMNEAAAEGGAMIAVGLMRRWWNTSRWTKAVLASGVLGRIVSFDIREGVILDWPYTSDFFFRRETAGGGVLMDLGAHTLDSLLWWLGDAASFTFRDDSYGGVEADCELDLTLASGATGIVELSRTRNLRNTAIIRGTQGEIEVSLHGGPISATPQSLMRERYAGLQAQRMPEQEHAGIFDAQLTDWLAAIKDRRPPAVPGVEAARSVALIGACYRERRPLELPWVNPRLASSSEPVATVAK